MLVSISVVATHVADCGRYGHRGRGVVNINTYRRLHFVDVRCVPRRVVLIVDCHAASARVSCVMSTTISASAFSLITE